MFQTKQRAINELPQKLKHERLMKRDLVELFAEMGEEFFISLLATGVLIDFQNFTPDMEALLKRNYRRTSKDFKFTARDRFDLGRTTEAVEIDRALAQFFDTTAKKRAPLIIQTTSKEASNAVDRTRRTAEEEGTTLTEEALAVGASAAFTQRSSKRSDTIAQTEVQEAAEGSKFWEALALASANAFVEKTRNEWDAILDRRTRSAHATADGQVTDVGQHFIVGGERLRWPGDTGLGASVGNTINCLHPNSVIDYADAKLLTRRPYKGFFVTIETSTGEKITVTPNHPVLTVSGWKAARAINKTDYIICTNYIAKPFISYFYIKNINPTVEQIYNSCGITPIRVGVGNVDMNFHGDISDKDVDIIFSNSFLRNRLKPSTGKIHSEFSFVRPDLCKGYLFAKRLLNMPALGNPFVKKFFNNRKLFIGRKVKEISHFKDSCYVYNLETKNSIYICNGIVNHNCRCSAQLITD
jgi:hypothetical protein